MEYAMILAAMFAEIKSTDPIIDLAENTRALQVITNLPVGIRCVNCEASVSCGLPKVIWIGGVILKKQV